MNAEWIGISIAWIGTFIALYQVWDLKKVRKREDSPYFELDGLLTLQFFWKNAKDEDVEGFSYPKGSSDVPADYPQGRPILIRCYNKGSEARMVKVETLTELECKLGWFERVSEDRDLQIYYSYDQERRGKIEKFKVTYETLKGESGYQIFEHPHGISKFSRVKIK